MFRTIIWATDGSEGADLALDEVLRLAQLAEARIVAVHCDERLGGRAAGWPANPEEPAFRIKIRNQVAALKDEGLDIDLVVRRAHREPARLVADVANRIDADLIVCGTRGLGAFRSGFTKHLLHVAPCPVLAVPDRSRLPRPAERETEEVGA